MWPGALPIRSRTSQVDLFRWRKVNPTVADAEQGRDWDYGLVADRAPRLPPGIGLLSLAHLLSDVYQGMLPVILLYQREVLGLSLSQIGVVAGVYNLVISLAQPLFGYLVDRWGERRVAVAGAVWVALLGGALGFAPSVGMLALLAGLSALGPAAFHPSGAAGVGRLATSRSGLSMSVFFVGGTLGHALGPLVAASVFDRIGIHGTAWIALGVVIVATGVLMKVPFAPPSARTTLRPAYAGLRPASREVLVRRTLWSSIAALLVVVGVRTCLQLSLATYVPQHLVSVGFVPSRASHWLSLMQAAVAVGVLIGGPLIDRIGSRALTTGVLVALAPIIIYFAQSTPGSAGLVLGLAGLLVGIPLSMTFVVGQSFLPEDRGLASGLVFATSSIAGAAGVALTGFVADHWGLTVALTALGVLPLITALAGTALPRQDEIHPVVAG
jgi:FSR family fosmidomycin resistance protein-like MFS transporter